jgi:hypothetical protein
MNQSNNTFTTWNLTKEEYRAGINFSGEQQAVIQNLIAQIAEDKLNLKFDPEHPSAFVQREAELAGQIGILKYLLNLSTTE